MGVKVVFVSGWLIYGMVYIVKEFELEKYGSFILLFNGVKIINCLINEELFSSILFLRIVVCFDDISCEEGVLIYMYVGDEIIIEVENKFMDIESDIIGLLICVVIFFIDVVIEFVVKVFMFVELEMLVYVEKKF